MFQREHLFYWLCRKTQRKYSHSSLLDYVALHSFDCEDQF